MRVGKCQGQTGDKMRKNGFIPELYGRRIIKSFFRLDKPSCCLLKYTGTGLTMYSIIIPVLKEEAIINSVISRLQNLDGNEETEIIVVDGDPEAGTLRAISSDDVRKIKSPRGRARQMNEGAGVARGNILVFLHADTELPSDALRLISTAILEKRNVAGAFDLGIKSERFVFRIIESVASLRSRITGIPFGDQAIFIRKDYFDKIGGYKDIPIMEDVEIMGRIKRLSGRIIITRQRVRTSPRRWEKETIIGCTLRNWLLQVLYVLHVSPDKLSKLYR
jgi:rSAM/selenodomain-associated transferase 2